MRILLISDHADPLVEVGSREAGGQNIYVLYLAKHLAQLGIQVDIFTRWDRRNKKEVVQINNNIRVIRVKAGPRHYIPKDEFLNLVDEFSENILKRIEKERLEYDVIHSNYWFSGLIALKVSEVLKIPIISVYHSLGKVRFDTFKSFNEVEENEYDFFEKRMKAEKEIAKKSEAVISTSPIEKNIVKKIFNITGKKIKMIPVGVDTKIFRPLKKIRARKILNIPETEKMILYVGRIEWRKGIGTLLYALHEIAKECPEVKLYVIGGGKSQSAKSLEKVEMDRLQKISEELGISDKVIFLGAKKQKNLYKFYSASDVCVVPSYYEPFGIVPLEAMACGTPVVASKTGGLQYTVNDGIVGYLAEPANYNELAEKIKSVLEKGKDYYREICLARVKGNFEWGKVASEYQSYLNQLSSPIK